MFLKSCPAPPLTRPQICCVLFLSARGLERMSSPSEGVGRTSTPPWPGAGRGSLYVVGGGEGKVTVSGVAVPVPAPPTHWRLVQVFIKVHG